MVTILANIFVFACVAALIAAAVISVRSGRSGCCDTGSGCCGNCSACASPCGHSKHRKKKHRA